MEDLKKWIGRKFLDFCKSDPDDEREIHYEMMTGDLSEKLEFTSREIVSMKTMEQIRKSIMRYLVNRAVYKAVKKYDHQQFENFCTDIYKSGWEDGKASVNALDVKDIEVVIRSVKGIGEVRIGKIMEAINEKFDENAGSKETE